MRQSGFRQARFAAPILLACLLSCPARPTDAQDTGGHNHLATEKSPYLLQHATNPVWWWSWSPAALAAAKQQDKPIFLSIGYSTCHWCHVMEKESFEKDDVARVLNGSYIAIKVDREERPDLDAHYMHAVELMSGRGGWPMTTVLLPDGRPFFGATYIRHDQLIATLQQIATRWKTDRSRIENFGAQLATGMAQGTPTASGGLTAKALLSFAAQQAQRFDPQYGGSKGAPKFPPSYALRTLLRIQRRRADEAALAQVKKTLDEMARGGIYDHVGGGFHRYSTDDHWLVPHFEKMLYDQAALVNAYLDGYTATSDPEYAAVAREILDYVLRDMTSPEGAFYSAEDADSEGEEGRFYLWKLAELKTLLSPAELGVVVEAYGVTAAGNFLGQNIFQLVHGARAQRPVLLTTALDKLRTARSHRVRPRRDDKVITSWNGLLITAMARAARMLDEPRYATAAQRAARFVLSRLRSTDGALLRRFRAGDARYAAYLTDYANLIDGLIELYQTDLDAGWLRQAVQLQALQEKKFAAPGGGYYLTDGSDPSLADRLVTFEDDVRPAGSSISALNLLRLADLFLDDAYRHRAARLFAAAPPEVLTYPSGFPVLLAALDYQLDSSKEVAIVGDPALPATRLLLAAVYKGFHPNQVVAAGMPGTGALPLLREKVLLHGRPTAYVCESKVCKLPTTDAAVVRQQLDASSPLQ